MLGINEKIKKFTKERKFNKQYSIFTSFLCVLTAAGVLSSLVMPAISATKIADDSTENDVNLLIGDNSYGSDITTVTNNLNNKFALGVASQFSVFLNGGFTIDEADTEGRIACAGGIDAKGYSDNYGYWDSYGNWQNAYYNIGKGHWYDNNTSIGFGDLGLNDDAAKVISNGGKFDYCSIQHWGGQYNNDFGYRYAFLEKNGFPANITDDYSKWWVYKYTNENDIIDFTSTFELLENRSKIIAENAENIADYANHPTVEVKKDENKVIFNGNKDGQTATAVTFNITSQQWAEINQMSGDKIHFEFKNIPQLATSIPGKEVNSNGNVDDVTWQSSYIMINVDAGTNVEIPNKDLRTSINGEFISKDDNGNLNNKFGCASLLYNFKDATSLTLGRNFQGTILAPKASVTDHGRIQHDDGSYGASGHLSGALVAQSFDGSMEFGYRPYQGPIEVIEKTYKVTINKLAKDANGNETTTHLAGATFEIYKLGENDVRGEKVATIITSDNKDNDYVMLPAGRYELVETHAPQGYIKNSESIKFEVIAPSSRKIIRRPTTTQTSTEITISDETSNVNDTTQDDNLLLDQNDTDTTGEQDTMSLFSIQSRNRVMALNGDANETYPYDYTIENILSTYEVFTLEDFTYGAHFTGSLATGGKAATGAHGGNNTIAIVPDYAGIYESGTVEQKNLNPNLYYGNLAEGVSAPEKSEKNANYIDMPKAFRYIKNQSTYFSQHSDYTVTGSDVKKYNDSGIEVGQNDYGNLYVSLNVDSHDSFTIPYSVLKDTRGINIVSSSDNIQNETLIISITGVNQTNITFESGANLSSIDGSSFNITFNGKGGDDFTKALLPNGAAAQENYNGFKFILNLPDATGNANFSKDGRTSLNAGHFVAPKATIQFNNNGGGGVIGKKVSFYNEAHFFPYNTINIETGKPTTTNTYETAGNITDSETDDSSSNVDSSSESSSTTTPTKGKITVVKHWSGDNENDRPNDIGNVKVYRSTNSTFDGNASELSTVSLYKGESWQKETSEFDIPNDGQTYYYFVRETSIPTGYSSSPTYNDGKQLDNNGNATLEITNIKEGGTTPDPTPDKGKLKITKQWKNNDGSNNTENHNQIEVKIKKNGSEVETVQLNSGNSWTVEREYDINSNETYTVEEINRPSDYDVSYENNNGVQLNKGYTQEIKVINTKKPTQTTTEKGSIKVKKVWQNDSNGTGRPSEVKFKLYRSTNQYDSNPSYYSEYTINKDDGGSNAWTKAIENLDITNSSNQPYYYYVKEVAVNGYNTTYENNNGVKAVGTSSGSGDSNWTTLNGTIDDNNVSYNYSVSVDTNKTYQFKIKFTENPGTFSTKTSNNSWQDVQDNLTVDSNFEKIVEVTPQDSNFTFQVTSNKSYTVSYREKGTSSSSGSTATIPEITITNTKQNSSSSSSSVPDSSSEDSSSTPDNPEEDVQILSGDGTITVYNQKESPKTGTLGIIKKWQDADGSSVAAPVSEVEFEVYRSTSSIAQPENFQNNSSSSSTTDTPTETRTELNWEYDVADDRLKYKISSDISAGDNIVVVVKQLGNTSNINYQFGCNINDSWSNLIDVTNSNITTSGTEFKQTVPNGYTGWFEFQIADSTTKSDFDVKIYKVTTTGGTPQAQSDDDKTYEWEIITPEKVYENNIMKYKFGNVSSGDKFKIMLTPNSGGMNVKYASYPRHDSLGGEDGIIEYINSKELEFEVNSSGDFEFQLLQVNYSSTEDDLKKVTVACYKQKVSGGNTGNQGGDDSTDDTSSTGDTTTSGKGYIAITPNLDGATKLNETIKVTKQENGTWSGELSGLELTDENGNDYYYYVKEKDSVTGFNCVAYQSNSIKLTESQTTSITVTNEKIETTGVVMPSTGGTGYSKFYIAGGTISIISLVLFALKKKKA